MKKAKVICKQSDTGHGVVFECSRCGKRLFVNTLCKRINCIRCDTAFKPIIKITRT